MARQRSALVHERVLNSALKLFSERGIQGTSMDAIANASGVSKATIYNHWADKEAFVLELLDYLNGLNERPRFDSGDTQADLVAVLSHRPPHARARFKEQLLPHLVTYSAQNTRFGQTWKSRVMEPARREIRQILTRGIERGELRADLNYDLSLALLLGPMMYSHVFWQAHARTSVLPEHVVDAFWKAFSLPPINAIPSDSLELLL
jgi:AcrR family transcriptional regulator